MQNLTFRSTLLTGVLGWSCIAVVMPLKIPTQRMRADHYAGRMRNELAPCICSIHLILFIAKCFM